MKEVKLNNVIFPLWFGLFVSPYVLIPIVCNLVLDGLIIYLGLYLNKAKLRAERLRVVVVKAWIFGFLADIVGVILLLLMDAYLPFFNSYMAWENPFSLLYYILVIIFVGWMIYRFNYRLLAKEEVDEKAARRTALAMGIITAPWLFLLPTRLSGL
ncbi:MAG: hypothetical protein HPY50_14055 [Firmicutes bacterium]|nr:hypothetical protein [Bacillota bacterium]